MNNGRIQKMIVVAGIGALALGLAMGAIRIDFNPESGRFYHPCGMPFYTVFVAAGCLMIGIVSGKTNFFTQNNLEKHLALPYARNV